MADPFSLAAVSMGATVAGTGISAAGNLMKGNAQAGMYGYQAGIAQLNQKIALQNRDYAYATGESEAAKYGMAARQRMGSIVAHQGASGLDIGGGSATQVREGQQFVTGIDLATIRNNAARRAYGFEVEATQDAAQSQLYTKAASDAKTAGSIGAVASLVSGAASVSDKWLQWGSVAGKGDQQTLGT